MKTKLSYKDLVLYTLCGSKAEITPCFYIVFKDNIDQNKLNEAVKKSLELYPLMNCGIIYDKGYYFETINKPYPIYNCKEENRPRSFKKDGNGYLWLISYYENKLYIDVSHSLSDGRGWMNFITAIINSYFGVVSMEHSIEDKYMEDVIDINAKGYFKKKQKNGYKRSDIDYVNNRDDVANLHLLVTDMKQVLDAAHKIEASPVTVLAPLFSQTLRDFIKHNAKNKNVSCIVPVDTRSILKYDSSHNSVSEAYFTYIDKFDDIDISKLSTIYRAMLDLQVQPESISEYIFKQKKMYLSILKLVNSFTIKIISKIAGWVGKQTQCNFVLTYLGKMNFNPIIYQNIEKIYWRSWHQFQDCNIAAVDFNNKLYIAITENYSKGNEIVNNFINRCKNIGIDIKEIENKEVFQVLY